MPERPRAVLVVSAHWQTRTPRVGSAARPGTLHDFGGFPRELFALEYPAPGDPALAGRVVEALAASGLAAEPDPQRPLDHGAWAVLRHLFPGADLPVVQVSLPRWNPADLVALGEALRPFREEGVLILASGGLVHNLGTADFSAPDDRLDPWAKEAESWFLDRLFQGPAEELLDLRASWPRSREAAPTTEHLDPIFVAMGAARPGEAPRTVLDAWQLGNMSLRCLAWG
jgi:4,5-DOPA dioxygenase extradiol